MRTKVVPKVSNHCYLGDERQGEETRGKERRRGEMSE